MMEYLYSFSAAWYVPLLVFCIFLSLIVIETAITGYRNSSLFLILHPQKTEWWDLYSWGTTIFGLRTPAANICLFGLFELIRRPVSESLDLRLSFDFLHRGDYLISFMLAFLMRDFLLYIRHRIRHTGAWLWNFHEFHHSAQRVSLFTTNRVHFIDSVTYFFMIVLPIQLTFGMQMRESVLFEITGWLFGLLNHSRIDTGFGWVGKYILMSPRDHHLHHERGGRQHKNFGECLVIWDRLFGTFERADKSLFQMNPGISNDFYHHRNFLLGIFLPIVRLYTIPIMALARREPGRGGGAAHPRTPEAEIDGP